jgi:hypothetical protein
LTTLAQASLTLQTARLHPSRFAPGLSTTHGDITTRDPGISPDRTHTGRPPRTCRSVYVISTSLSSWRPSSLGAPRESGRRQPPDWCVHSGLAGLALWGIDNPHVPKAVMVEVAAEMSGPAVGGAST